MNYRKYNWNFDLIKTPLPTLTERLQRARMEIAEANIDCNYWIDEDLYICNKCGNTYKMWHEMVNHDCENLI